MLCSVHPSFSLNITQNWALLTPLQSISMYMWLSPGDIYYVGLKKICENSSLEENPRNIKKS